MRRLPSAGWLGLAGLPAVLACGSTAGPPAAIAPAYAEPTATVYTSRVAGRSAEEIAVGVSQAVFPASAAGSAPRAVLLAPADPYIALTAWHRVGDPSLRAALLYVDRSGRLAPATRAELHRLKPGGVPWDGNTRVYVVGAASAPLARDIGEQLGWPVRRFTATDPPRLAEELDRWHGAVTGGWSRSVTISGIDHPDGPAHGIGALWYHAHAGGAFGWVFRDSIPAATAAILARRDGRARIYVTAPATVVSDAVIRILSRYGAVRRVTGADPVASSVVQASYRDVWRGPGFGLGTREDEYGWGITRPGHAFVLASPANLAAAIPAAMLAHTGKRGPLLLVRRDTVPVAVARYLESVRPLRLGPRETLLNHGWIVGDTAMVSWPVQRALTLLLSPTPERALAAGGEGP